jgi:hypothetical protein
MANKSAVKRAARTIAKNRRGGLVSENIQSPRVDTNPLKGAALISITPKGLVLEHSSSLELELSDFWLWVNFDRLSKLQPL